MLKKIPHTYTIIFSIILLCAVLSWIIPAGEYSRHTVEVNGTTRSVIVDNSYHAVESVPQTWQVFSALLQGFEKQAGIIAFLLIIGGAFQIMNNSRAIDVGIFSFLDCNGWRCRRKVTLFYQSFSKTSGKLLHFSEV